jgi:UvrB/uvrC motif
LAGRHSHIRLMDFDISHLLDQWEYQPGQVVARRFKAKNGRAKIQLRLDLGVLQMNAEGRPDGKRPFGHASLFDHYRARLRKHVAAHDGSEESFKLKAEDCSRLQLEALQYHHRYICLLHLEDYAGAIRDAERNLAVFDFVDKHAESEEWAWSLEQFRPQLLMVLARARAAQALEADNYEGAVRQVEEGLAKIRAYHDEHGRGDAAEASGEVQSLESWLEEIRARRPLSARERLERALRDAINSEDYERAAKVRDALRNLKPAE